MKKWVTNLVDKVLHRYILRKMIEFFEQEESDMLDAQPDEDRTSVTYQNIHRMQLMYVQRQQRRLKHQLERE